MFCVREDNNVQQHYGASHHRVGVRHQSSKSWNAHEDSNSPTCPGPVLWPAPTLRGGAGRGGRGAVPAARHSQPLTHPTGFQIQTCKQCFTRFGTECTGDDYATWSFSFCRIHLLEIAFTQLVISTAVHHSKTFINKVLWTSVCKAETTIWTSIL